jgi:predicted PurR-regulated permease PerM
MFKSYCIGKQCVITVAMNLLSKKTKDYINNNRNIIRIGLYITIIVIVSWVFFLLLNNQIYIGQRYSENDPLLAPGAIFRPSEFSDLQKVAFIVASILAVSMYHIITFYKDKRFLWKSLLITLVLLISFVFVHGIGYFVSCDWKRAPSKESCSFYPSVRIFTN